VSEMGNKSTTNKSPPLPPATNSTTTTTKTDDEVIPTPPQLKNIKTVQTSEPVSSIGALGAELAREFMEGDGPKYWNKMTANDTLVEVSPKSKEYAQALRHFRKTSSKVVTKIERVQNKFLWRRYQAKKISMMSKNKVSLSVLPHTHRQTQTHTHTHTRLSHSTERIFTGYYQRASSVSRYASYTTG